jgi:hypothetical protein
MGFVRAVTVEYHEVHTYRPRKPSRRSPWLYAIIAAFCAFWAVVAAVLNVDNRSRLERYQGDSSCRAPLTSPAAGNGSLCSAAYARVVDRWVTWHKSTGYYHLGLTAPDGAIDSVELKGAWRQSMWDMAPMGASLLVQRFREPQARRPRVTLVRTLRSVARTEWNPAWHADDTMRGVVFLSAVAVVALIAFVRARAKAAT